MAAKLDKSSACDPGVRCRHKGDELPPMATKSAAEAEMANSDMKGEQQDNGLPPPPSYTIPSAAICPAEVDCCVAIDKAKIKTVLCVNYMHNRYCPFGAHCAFAHGPDELRRAQSSERKPDGVAVACAPPPRYDEVVGAAMRPSSPATMQNMPPTPSAKCHAATRFACDEPVQEQCTWPVPYLAPEPGRLMPQQPMRCLPQQPYFSPNTVYAEQFQFQQQQRCTYYAASQRASVSMDDVASTALHPCTEVSLDSASYAAASDMSQGTTCDDTVRVVPLSVGNPKLSGRSVLVRVGRNTRSKVL